MRLYVDAKQLLDSIAYNKGRKARRANLVQNRVLSVELQISLPQTHDRIT